MKNWFKRKPKVVRMQLGDYLDLHVTNGGIRYHLRFTEITSDLNEGTTVIFTDVQRQHLFGNFVN